MNIVYFHFLNFLTYTVANDCECEAEAWNEWGACSCNNQQERSRICSTTSAWALGFSCTDADNRIKYEYRSCTTSTIGKLFYLCGMTWEKILHFSMLGGLGSLVILQSILRSIWTAEKNEAV